MRDEAVRIDAIPGAAALQQYFDRATWIQNTASPNSYAPFMRHRPLPGMRPRPVLIQTFRGDQTSANPMTNEVIRAGHLEDTVTHYRHDLVWAEHPTVQKNPHVLGFRGLLLPVVGEIMRSGQDQLNEFMQTDGAVISQPQPARFWQTPIPLPLSYDFGYIP